MSDAKQKLAGMFRRGVPEVDGDQFNLLLCGVVALLIKKHGRQVTAKMLNTVLDGLSKPANR